MNCKKERNELFMLTSYVCMLLWLQYLLYEEGGGGGESSFSKSDRKDCSLICSASENMVIRSFT